MEYNFSEKEIIFSCKAYYDGKCVIPKTGLVGWETQKDTCLTSADGFTQRSIQHELPLNNGVIVKENDSNLHDILLFAHENSEYVNICIDIDINIQDNKSCFVEKYSKYGNIYVWILKDKNV